MNRFRRRPNQKGFTMIELMVVVVIVGVLAAVAIPIYGKYIKNAKLTEATGRIGEIITACKAVAQENEVNGVAQWPTAAQLAAGTVIDLTNSANFSYAVTGGLGANATLPANAITVTATGVAGGFQGPPAVTVAVQVSTITANGGKPVVNNL